MRLQQDLREIRYAEHLPDVTLVVIGLWNMGYTDIETVAHLLWIVDIKPLRRLFKMLKTSADPLIRQFVDVGLPPGVYRQLPMQGRSMNDPSCKERRLVHCPLCGHLLNCVPCPQCSLTAPVESGFRFRNRGTIPPCPEHRTSAAPGSLRKIAVMRERVERGERAIHPRDKRLPRKANA